jgi:hypothetical protein
MRDCCAFLGAGEEDSWSGGRLWPIRCRWRGVVVAEVIGVIAAVEWRWCRVGCGIDLWQAHRTNASLTTGDPSYAVCLRHTAKLQKRTAKLSPWVCARQTTHGNERHGKHPMPCAFPKTHGEVFAVCCPSSHGRVKQLTSTETRGGLGVQFAVRLGFAVCLLLAGCREG